MDVLAQETAVKTLPYIGVPWVSKQEKKGRSTLYKVNLDVDNIQTIEIDIRLDEPSAVTFSIEGWGGKTWAETKKYEVGLHTLSYHRSQLMVDEKNISIRSIEVGVEKEDILMVSTLSVK